MFGGALGDLLPLAVGIAISPVPIIACILMLFSARGRLNAPAYLVGWVVGITVVTVLVVYLTDTTGANDAVSGPSMGDLVILLLGIGAFALAIKGWRGRPKPGETAALPSWMQAIDGFSPLRALGFGIFLSACNPKNLGLAIAAGLVIDGAVEAGGSEAAMVIAFVILASLSVIVPLLYVLVGGEGAKRTLEGWKTWLTANNAGVMAVLLLVIGAALVGSGLDGLLG